ncbi:MAG: ABC transporter ATP-binding protein [Lautropia sp.]
MLFTLQGVRSGYGKLDVLHGLDLAVRQGEVVAVLGPNGAGKSVLLKTMAGLLRAREGQIHFGGADVTTLPAAERARRGLALLPQSDLVFPAMTVEENLLMGVYVEPDRRRRREVLERTYERYPDVASYRRKPANSLSGGQQKMVGLARAMMLEPRALLLDEPSIGLDPKTLAFFAGQLATLNERGVTLILVEQNIRFALRAARRVCFLRMGRIVRDEPASAFAQGSDILSLYFGNQAVPAAAS